MTIEEKNTNIDSTVDPSVDPVAAPPEKVYTQSQLAAILARKTKEAIEPFQSKLTELETIKAELESLRLKTKEELPIEERWKKEASDLKKKLELAYKEKTDLELSYKQEKKTARLQSKITELAAKATKPALVAKLIADAIKIGEDDTIYAEIGDSIIPPEEYVNKFFIENPEFLPAPIGGTGGAKELKNPLAKPVIKSNTRMTDEEIKRNMVEALKSR